MVNYDTLRDMLCAELEEFAQKGELNTGDLDVIHKLVGTIKDTYKIDMLESDDGYSRMGGEWEADMRGSYGRGDSYARRGSHYVRGHYSREGDGGNGSGGGGGGYSQRRGGYSRSDGREDMMEQLQQMRDNAGNEKEREALRRCMEQLNQA